MAHFGFPLETIIFSIYMDLVAHKNSEEITVKNAAMWSLFWISLADFTFIYIFVLMLLGRIYI